jgi:hypothetical protein
VAPKRKKKTRREFIKCYECLYPKYFYKYQITISLFCFLIYEHLRAQKCIS